MRAVLPPIDDIGRPRHAVGEGRAHGVVVRPRLDATGQDSRRLADDLRTRIPRQALEGAVDIQDPGRGVRDDHGLGRLFDGCRETRVLGRDPASLGDVMGDSGQPDDPALGVVLDDARPKQATFIS